MRQQSRGVAAVLLLGLAAAAQQAAAAASGPGQGQQELLKFESSTYFAKQFAPASVQAAAAVPAPTPYSPTNGFCAPGYGYVPYFLFANTTFLMSMCVPCQSGYYGPGGPTNIAKCLICGQGEGFMTPQGASSASQCLCLPGFGGALCLQCQAGQYSPGGRITGSDVDARPACSMCPDSMTGSSKPGATSLLACGGCAPGFGGNNCAMCKNGYYSAGGNRNPCIKCGPGLTSQPGSPSLAFCQCVAGLGADSTNSKCVPCPLGTFNQGPPKTPASLDVQAKTTRTSKGKASIMPCKACNAPNKAGMFTTLQEGSKNLAACVCQPGAGSKLCNMCPIGSWSSGGTKAACTRCQSLAATAAPGATGPEACLCPPGTGGQDCSVCPENTFSEGGLWAFCRSCPANTETGSGAGSISSCVPKPGYGLRSSTLAGNSTAQLVAVKCDPGTYSSGGIWDVCRPCPPNTDSPSGASDIAQCVCLPTFKPGSPFWSVGCVKCVNEVCPGGTSGGTPSTIDCGANKYAPDGATSLGDCVCKPGTGGPNCDPCQEGEFAAGGSRDSCQPCGPGKTSAKSSVSASACVCKPGFGGPDCDLCQQGTYSVGGSAALSGCTPCPAGSSTFDATATGATDQSMCLCLPGFAGPSCAKCSDTQVCPGGTRLAPQLCPPNSYTLQANATSTEQCVCVAGTGAKAGGGNTAPTCEPCEQGTWSAGGALVACTPCGNGRTTSAEMSTSESACVCKPSYGGASCGLCPENTFSVGFSRDDCSKCPDASLSPPGSDSSADCICKPGFAGPGCTACSAGTYSVGGSNAQCTLCGADGSFAAGFTTIPSTAAASSAACVCKPGMGGSACNSCKAGEYSPGLTTNPCFKCPEGTTSPANSVSAADCIAIQCLAGQELSKVPGKVVQCVCKAGFGAGSATQPCSPCDAGFYSPGGSYDACIKCPVGFYSAPAAASCVDATLKCPSGQYLPSPSSTQCVCRPGFGGDEKGNCALCDTNTYSPGGNLDPCLSCGFGKTSAKGSASASQCVEAQKCPFGQTAPAGAVSLDQCSCKAGFGGDATRKNCQLCPVGFFSSGGSFDPCLPCKFGTTSWAGSSSEADCRATSQCPSGTYAPPNATAADQCVCKPGMGGTEIGGICSLCPISYYSPGGVIEPCRPCGFSLTSPAGSTMRQACQPSQGCPYGQVAPQGAASSSQCSCRAGFGGDPANRNTCVLCPVGTFSAGGDFDPCLPCPFGYTSFAGSINNASCFPTDQCFPGTFALPDATTTDMCVCKPGQGGNAERNRCSVCPIGSYSSGGNMEPCKTCPFGKTSAAGSYSVDDCVTAQACPSGQLAPPGAVGPLQCACRAGFASDDGKTCKLCGVGFYSGGGSFDQCLPCGFGFTSKEGSTSLAECFPAEQCPTGAYALPGATTSGMCVCQPGKGGAKGAKSGDPCQLCPIGSYSTGGTMDECRPCPFGTDSAAGSTSPDDCVPTQQCPSGQYAPPGAVSASQCSCKPGYGGNPTGKNCTLCPYGFYSEGGSFDPCLPCTFGRTSPQGSASAAECRDSQTCPYGQLAPPDAVGPAQCGCRPGYGGDSTRTNCELCPIGYWSVGGNFDPCQPCPFGSTSFAGSTDAWQCFPADQCPVGSLPLAQATTKDMCVCKAGWGANADGTQCQVCPIGFYGMGGTMEKCRECPFGTTSAAESRTIDDCVTSQKCPTGQVAPPDAVDARQCACQAGFGGTDGKTCSVCPVGFYAPGGTFDPCLPCKFGFTSDPQSDSIADCRFADQCPSGTQPAVGATTSGMCFCRPGYGGAVGAKAGDKCSRCGIGFYAEGGTMEECKKCPFGKTSPAGSTTVAACVAAQTCPSGQIAPPNAVGPEQCSCQPGYGGNPQQTTCVMCQDASYSAGGNFDPCIPCPVGTTSKKGAVNWFECTAYTQTCPFGQFLPWNAVSERQCSCLPGFGGDATRTSCQLCGVGFYSAGLDFDPCLPCPFGTTSRPGSTDLSQCYPDDQCPVGTVPLANATTTGMCVCKSGWGGSANGMECGLCPIGTYNPGGNMEPCKLCPFGTTSAAGTANITSCVASQNCTSGQVAPPGAVDVRQCSCSAGYGSTADSPTQCKLCGVGFYSRGGTFDPCLPCGFGYTSLAGAKDRSECFATVQCPAGTYTNGTNASTIDMCVCQPGFGGSVRGGACSVCAVGEYSPGGAIAPCLSCGFGFTSRQGATSKAECFPENQCPPGTFNATTPITKDACVCLPGHGGKELGGVCTPCGIGEYAPGGITEPCKLCQTGFFSNPMSTKATDCQACPTGTFFPGNPAAPQLGCQECPQGSTTATGNSPATSLQDCTVCLPGYGAGRLGATLCEQCAEGYYSAGVAAPCSKCPPGMTSQPGSVLVSSCYCAPGYGIMPGQTGTDICYICAPGTYSLGEIGKREQCVACGIGYTTVTQFLGTTVSGAGATSKADCVCQRGYGSSQQNPNTCQQCLAPAYNDKLGSSIDPFPPCLPCESTKVGNKDGKCLAAGSGPGITCGLVQQGGGIVPNTDCNP